MQVLHSVLVYKKKKGKGRLGQKSLINFVDILVETMTASVSREREKWELRMDKAF